MIELSSTGIFKYPIVGNIWPFDCFQAIGSRCAPRFRAVPAWPLCSFRGLCSPVPQVVPKNTPKCLRRYLSITLRNNRARPNITNGMWYTLAFCDAVLRSSSCYSLFRGQGIPDVDGAFADEILVEAGECQPETFSDVTGAGLFCR